MKLHPLHTPDQLFAEMLHTGEYPDRSRATGRSTAQALHYISVAISNPGKCIRISDHFDTADADAHLTAMCGNIIELLGLHHFHLKGNTICFGERSDSGVYALCCGPSIRFDGS